MRPYGYIGKLLAGNAVDIQPVGVTAVTQRNAAYEQIAVVTIVNPETVDGCELASECESKVEGVDRNSGRADESSVNPSSMQPLATARSTIIRNMLRKRFIIV